MSEPTSQLDPAERKDAALKFFRTLFGHEPLRGLYFGLWFRDNKQSAWFTDPEAMATVALERSAATDVYFRPTPLAQPLEPSLRGNSDDSAALVALTADMDIGREGHKKTKLPADLASVQRVLTAFPLPHSLTVASGGGAHVYWLLDIPRLLRTPSEVKAARALAEAFQKRLKATAASLGYHVDSTFDLARVLRVPGTVNYKIDQPRPVGMHEDLGHRYSLAQLREVAEIDRHQPSDRVPKISGKKIKPSPATDRLHELLSRDRRFAATWAKQRTDLQDQSLSSYDLSLASTAVSEGWSDAEIGWLIHEFRGRHAQDPAEAEKALRADYIARTIAKAPPRRNRGSAKPATLPPLPVFKYPYGIELTAIGVQTTPTKTTVRFAVAVGGKPQGEVCATDNPNCVPKVRQTLVELLGGGPDDPTIGPDQQRDLTRLLRQLVTRSSIGQIADAVRAHTAAAPAPEANGSGRLMHEIVANYMRRDLDLRFIEESGAAWSEILGRTITQSEFCQRAPAALLAELRSASDYPVRRTANPATDIRDLHQILKVVWTELTRALPAETGRTALGPDSRAAQRFQQQLAGVLLAPEVWIRFDGDAQNRPHTERFSLAARAADINVPATGHWLKVVKGVSVFVRRRADAQPALQLGIRYDAVRHAVKGQAIPIVRSQWALTTLMRRYGLSTDAECDVVAHIDGTAVRLCVLSPVWTRRLVYLEDPAQSDTPCCAPEGGPRATEGPGGAPPTGGRSQG